MKAKLRIILAVFAALASLCLLCCAVYAYGWYMDNRCPNFEEEAGIFVYPDTGVDEVFDMIVDEAKVKSARSLSRVFSQKQVACYMKPGHYVIKPSYSSVYVARMLNNGWQSPTKLVLSGTLRTKSALAKRISSQMMVDSTSVANALDDEVLLSGYGFTPQNVFSMFIPDTYEMYWTASVEEILSRQKEMYDQFWTEENLSKAEALGLTQEQVSVVASIVNGETNFEPEMPSVAGVYLNRYRTGMKLQADPTIAYILDYKVNRILNKYLDIDSPYNTYKYAGLPPGPICVPTRSSLEAVLNPDRHAYLYFCANSNFDGTHKFASSYPEHLRNARAFQSALNKREAQKRAGK